MRDPVARLLVLAALVCAVGYVFITGNYLLTALGFAAVYVVFVAGLNVFMGYAGQVSFGQNAFAAIGGYGSAVLTTTLDWPPVPALLASAALAAAVATVVGLATLRLRGHYLAMGTLALGLISYEAAVQWEQLTGGYMGISGIPALSIGGFSADTDRQVFAVLALAACLAVWTSQRLRHSRLGRAIGALAGSDEAAAALSINVARTKLASFVVAAIYASVSGSLLAHAVGYISPEVFGLHMVVLAFTMLYVGGIGTTFGPLIGALVIGMLPEVIRGFRDVQDLVYGAALILILIRAPRRPGRGAEAMSLLEVEHLTRRFGGLVALGDVSFSISAGQIAAVIGPNGAGKTTLFNLISGFMAPSAGRVKLDGQDLAGRAPHQVAALGLVRTFQLVRPFTAMSIAENVRVGMHLRTHGGVLGALLGQRTQERQVAEQAIALLDRVGLAGLGEQKPDTLGYGQLRLLEIARALAARPRLLLLDEPAAGLNHLETDRLGALIRTLGADGITILLIEHDMRLVMDLAEHVVVLDFGCKIAEGPAADVARDPAVLDAYLGGVDA